MMSTVGEEDLDVYNNLRRLESVLNNKTESFPNKVESLIQVWKQVSQCRITEHKQNVVHLMDWLKLHTLNIVLTGDWKKCKDDYEERLLKEVEHCEVLLRNSNNIFSLRCRKLAEVIKDPWGSPILNRLLNNPDTPIGPEEIEFFCIETGYLISTRLRKLCESHCEDLALNLVTTFMRCDQIAEDENISLNATEDQRRFILDVYIALLFKYKRTAVIVSKLKTLPLSEGLKFLKRFAHKRVNISKIWRNSNRIAHLAAQVYLTAALTKTDDDTGRALEGLLDIWLSLGEVHDDLELLMKTIRRIIQTAESAVHLYIFCEAVHKKFGFTMKTFTIELFIRALTTDMNDLERQKNEDDTVKVAEITKRLACGFLRLADILDEHVKVSRECVLTSFSLLPTQPTLDRIVELAARSGYEVLDTGQNWRCKLHPPVQPSDEISFKCEECGEPMSYLELESPLNTNTALSEALTAEQLGLARQLCDDLVVVLSSPRYQLFNWLLRWRDLHRLCVLYLKDPERTKNFVTELKFVEIDYSVFLGMKREPEDEELTGIERGYEKYLEDELYPEEPINQSLEDDTTSQDSKNFGLDSDGMDDSLALFPPTSAKSNPEVLKSLRLFRPSLKRPKLSQLDCELPHKVFVPNQSISPFVNTNSTSVSYHNNNMEYPGSSMYLPENSSAMENTLLYQPCAPESVSMDCMLPQSMYRLENKSKPDNMPTYNCPIVNWHKPSTYPYIPPVETVVRDSSEKCTSKWDYSSHNSVHNYINRSHPNDVRKIQQNLETRPNDPTLNGSKLTKDASLKDVMNTFIERSLTDSSNGNDSCSNNLSRSNNFDIFKPEHYGLPPPTNFQESTNPNYAINKPSTSNQNFRGVGRNTDSPEIYNTYLKIDRKEEIMDLSTDKIHGLNHTLNSIFDFKYNYNKRSLLKRELEKPRTIKNSRLTTERNQFISNFEDNFNCSTKNPVVSLKKLQTKDIIECDIPSKTPLQSVDSLFPLEKASTPKNRIFDEPKIFQSPLKNGNNLDASNAFASNDNENYETTQPYVLLNGKNWSGNFSNHCKNLIPENLAMFKDGDDSIQDDTILLDLKQTYAKRSYKNVHKDEKDSISKLIKKYDLKEASVVLHRLSSSDISNYKKYRHNRTSKAVISPATRRKYGRKCVKKSENKNREKSKGKSNVNQRNKTDMKPWPLQDINPKVNRRKEKDNLKSINVKNNIDDLKNVMNPRVVLKRLEFDGDKKRNANSVLSSVPGLNDLQMIRPSSVDRIVQVVQVPGARCPNTAPIQQNTQTSTQITPHIQRIGQPRTEKPEPVDSESPTSVTNTTTTSTATTTTSESSALINVLSQQTVRPNNQSNIMTLRPRASPLINILSQQIIKPATSGSSTKMPSSGTSEVQVNSLPRVITGGEQILSQLINPVRTPTPTLKTLTGAPTSDQNRIVQFICKSSDGKLIPVTSFTSNKLVKVSMTQTMSSSGAGTVPNEETSNKLSSSPIITKIKTEVENSDTLPKFQQAFGKPTYQKSIDATERVTVTNETVNPDLDKSPSAIIKTPSKNSNAALNIQPVQGGVIYTRQMPVGQTINLIPPGRGQVFRIATSNAEQLSLVKDTVIHGKMSALLAAALQGKQRTGENNQVEIISEESSPTNARAALTARPTLVQNARIVKPVLQIPSNVIRNTPQSNLSSTTLEQLREFDMVYKQVKERSSTGAPTESSPQSDSNEPPQQISVTYLNQNQKINCAPVVVVSSYCNVQPAASPSLSVTSQGSSSPCVTPAPTLALSKNVNKSSKTKNIKSAATHTAKTTPIPKPQQKPQEDEHTTQRIFDILAEYAEQLRNSPDLNNKPAPRRRSNPPTNPNQNTKRKKNSTSKKTGHCSNSLASDGDIEDAHTAGSEDSSCGVVQISVQEEEQPLSSGVTDTNEASISPKQLILTDSTPNQSRNLIIADSNVGEALKMSNTAVLVPGNYIMPVSMVKGGQQIAVVSGGSKILATVPARSGPNMLLFQSFLNQTRKHNLPTVKYSTVQPISGITRNMSNTSTQPPTATVPANSQNFTAVTLAQTVALQKVNQTDRTDMSNFDTELLLTISHQPDNKGIIDQQQSNREVITSCNENVQNIPMSNSILNSDHSSEKAFVYDDKSLVNTSVATSVIAQAIDIKVEPKEEEEEQSTTTQTIMALNLNSSDCEKDTAIKVEGRVQSVLVATGTTNGPMLSHSPPAYNKQSDSTNSISESNKDEYIRNEGKVHRVLSCIDGQSLLFNRHILPTVVAEDCIL